tara:strand:+ start:2390 stop:3088 length:699 start_codon:yes stop_codon:yes gene_type:complete
MKSFKSFYEEFTFRVDVEGLPDMFMKGNSPGAVKAHLRKLVKQPSMIKSVDRMTKHDVKKTYRAKAQGKEVSESSVNELSPDTMKSYRKKASQSNYSAAQKYARIANSPTGRNYKKKEMGKQDDIMRKRKAGLARVDKKLEGTMGQVDYASDKSVKIMKKMTPGENVNELSFDKMNKYHRDAQRSKDRATNSAVATILRKGDHSKDLQTRNKRMKGMALAKSRTLKKIRGDK